MHPETTFWTESNLAGYRG